MALPVKLGNGAKSAIHLVGKGYHPLPGSVGSLHADSAPGTADSADMQQALNPESTLRMLWNTQIESRADKATWPGFSPASYVQLPRQLLSLSHGVVSFGPVSIQGVSKRIVALMAGNDFGVEFEWHLDVLAAQQGGLLDGQLQIEPASGKVPPNGCCLCKLTFTAGLKPQLFEAGIKCHISAVAELLSPLQPARLPSLNSPLNSPRTAGTASSQAESTSGVTRAESAQALAGSHSPAQHGHRSPRLATSPRKAASRSEQSLAGAPVRQGSLKSPARDKSQTSPSRAIASQNRAPMSRTSSVNSPEGKKAMSPQKSPPKSSGKTLKAPSPVKAPGKASSSASIGRLSSSTASGTKPVAKSPHKMRRESGQLTVLHCT